MAVVTEKDLTIIKYSSMPFCEVVQMAEAYQDALSAWYEKNPGRPLSTTLGFLIRQDVLVLKETEES